MGPNKKRIGKVSPQKASVRASISFPTDLYSNLEQIATQKKVSLAWVVRDAVDQYMNEKWPLFVRKQAS